MLGRTLDDSFPPAIRRDVTTVTLARLCANALYRYAGPFLAIIASGLDISIGELGLAITIAELCGLASPVIGRFVDAVSRRLSMVVGLAGVAAGGMVTAASPNVVVFTIGLFTLSLFKIVYDVGMGSWITDHVAFERRGRVVGLTETSWALGLLVGVSTMGLITAVTSWQWGYATAAVAVAVMATRIWTRIDAEPTVAHRRSEVPDGPRPGVRDLGLERMGPSVRCGTVRSGLLRSPDKAAVMLGRLAYRLGNLVRGSGRPAPVLESPVPVVANPASAPAPTARVPVTRARLPLAGRLGVLGVLALSGASQSLFVTFGAWLDDEFGIDTAVLAAITFGLGALELAASGLSTARTDRWGKERSVIGGAVVMMVAAAAFVAADERLIVGLILIGLFIAGFEFAIVSVIPMGGDLVPGRPGQGLGYFLAATALGRSLTTVPATRLYEANGIVACALLGLLLAAGVAAAMAGRLRAGHRPQQTGS